MLLNRFQWNKCDIIFQLLGASAPDPDGAPLLDPAGGRKSRRPLTQLDTPYYQILENTLRDRRNHGDIGNEFSAAN